MSEVWSANFVLLSITDVAYFLLVPLLATSPLLSALKHKVKHCAGERTQQRCRRGDSHVHRHWWDPFWGRINSNLPGSDAAFLPIVFLFFFQRQKEKLRGIGAGWFHPAVWKYQGGKCFKMTWNWAVQPWPSMLALGQLGQSKTQLTTGKSPQKAHGEPPQFLPLQWGLERWELQGKSHLPWWTQTIGLKARPRGKHWGLGCAESRREDFRGGMVVFACARSYSTEERSNVFFTLSWDTIQKASSQIQAEQQEEYPSGKEQSIATKCLGKVWCLCGGKFSAQIRWNPSRTV